MTNPEPTKAQAAAIALLAKGDAYRSIEAFSYGGPVVSDAGQITAVTANALIRNGWAVWGPEENEQKALHLTEDGDAHLPDWYRAWRDRFESGDTEEDVQRLKLSGWVPAAGFPARVTDPLVVQCIRCGAELEIVLGPLVLDEVAPPTCRHTGRKARPLTPEERQELRDIRKRFREEM